LGGKGLALAAAALLLLLRRISTEEGWADVTQGIPNNPKTQTINFLDDPPHWKRKTKIKENRDL
jgi:hypothetical protein